MPSPRSFLLVLLGAFAAWTGTAAPATDLAAPHEKAEAFFRTIIGGDTAKAFDTLLAGSNINANRSDTSYDLRRQLQTAVSNYGKPLGYDAVEYKIFGSSLIRVVYILRLEKFPLTWEIFFYENGSGTCVPIDVRFNDRLDVYRYDRVPAVSGDDSAAPAP